MECRYLSVTYQDALHRDGVEVGCPWFFVSKHHPFEVLTNVCRCQETPSAVSEGVAADAENVRQTSSSGILMTTVIFNDRTTL